MSREHGGEVEAAEGVWGEEGGDLEDLPAMARMDLLGAFALTEPAHGSDSIALETGLSAFT